MAEITSRPFGWTKDGSEITAYTLYAGNYSVRVLTLGGIIQSFNVPCRGAQRDIVLGFDTPAQYERQSVYCGALIGRVANRIGKAAFSLKGKTYFLEANDGANCLHGGACGFDRALWRGRAENGMLVLTHTSPDSEGGFPGTLRVQVIYRLSADGALTLEYQAQSDANTLCSLTNHSYFNLMGHSFGSLEGHRIQIMADAITEIDKTGIPTGRILSVHGTAFDLRQPNYMELANCKLPAELEGSGGYDHNFVLHHQPWRPLQLAARALGDNLCLECYTTQPGLQFYTANCLDSVSGKQGAVYGRHSSFCLETQGWPDGIHHPGFPSCVLPAGECYRQTTVYRVTEI